MDTSGHMKAYRFSQAGHHHHDLVVRQAPGRIQHRCYSQGFCWEDHLYWCTKKIIITILVKSEY